MFARLGNTLRHWLIPHHSNNFRARLLHNVGYLAVLGIFLSLNMFVRTLDSSKLHILGFTSSVTIDETVAQVNERRIAAGLKPLKLNDTLSDAARRKAANMYSENYWAHNSPSGLTPWTWFNQVGYRYTHAGENLAKDFSATDRMVAAWMASPTHASNILNDKFTETGIAVVPGSLLGKDTVLVVQLFGSTTAGTVVAQGEAPTIAQVQGVSNTPKPVVTPVPTPVITPAPTLIPSYEETVPVMELKEFATPIPSPNLISKLGISGFDLKKLLSLVTTALLILVLLGDVIIAENNKLSRRVGKNWAHILFINVILILVTIVNAGSII